MSHRCLVAVSTALVVLALTATFAEAQSADTTMPRTPWGAPDLQGVWDLVIPYLIVYGGKLDERFDIW